MHTITSDNGKEFAKHIIIAIVGQALWISISTEASPSEASMVIPAWSSPQWWLKPTIRQAKESGDSNIIQSLSTLKKREVYKCPENPA